MSTTSAHRVRGDGADLMVVERGDPARPAVLLVHGYPDTHTVWDPVADRLAARFRVITYDVRGAGASSRPRGTAPYGLAHLMSDMRAVLDDRCPDRPVHLAGHDWGAIQSWEAVTTMPGRFASFTSVSGPCLDHVALWARDGGTAGRARQLLKSWYIGFFRLPLLPELSWRAGVLPRLVRRPGAGAPANAHFGPTLKEDGLAGLGLYRANMSARLRDPGERRTEVPTQLIVPTRDSFVSPELAEAAPRPFVPDLRVRRVDAGHWVPVSHPGVVAGLIERHITEVLAAEGSRDLWP